MEIKKNGANNIEDTAAEQVVFDHSKDVLVGNDTTFAELIRMLASSPEAEEAAKHEAEEKAQEEREAELRKAYGEDYDLIFEKKDQEEAEQTPEKPKRRPGAMQLRNGYPRVAMIELSEGGSIEVFNNGYAIYDNGDRKTVLWVPDCGSVTYFFGGLRDNQKDYLPQKDEIGEDEMGQFPWYNALLVAGENRIEYNMDHPKSKGSTSDYDVEDSDIKPAYSWIGGAHFDSPEEAYLKKEAAEERKKVLTEKQRKVYVLRYELGMTQDEIAEKLGISQVAVFKLLKRIKNSIEVL